MTARKTRPELPLDPLPFAYRSRSLEKNNQTRARLIAEAAGPLIGEGFRRAVVAAATAHIEAAQRDAIERAQIEAAHVFVPPPS